MSHISNSSALSRHFWQVVNIKTYIRDDQIIIAYFKIENSEIPNSLSLTINEKALTTILFNSDEEVILNFLWKNILNLLSNLDLSRISVDDLNLEKISDLKFKLWIHGHIL